MNMEGDKWRMKIDEEDGDIDEEDGDINEEDGDINEEDGDKWIRIRDRVRDRVSC